MGACDYQTTSHGRTVSDAYRNACDEARACNGHQEGYSGDIQTSSGYREVRLPKGLTAAKALQYAYAYNEADWAWQAAKEAIDDAARWPNDAKHYDKVKREQMRTYHRLMKSIPERHRETARQIARLTNEKRGPAVALELRGKAATEHKRQAGRSGTRDRVWVFAGLAAC